MILKNKIAIDSGPLTSGDSVRGIGVYTRELLKALKMDGVDVSKEDLGKYDIVHFTRFNPFFVSVPFFKPKKTKFILTIYDLIYLIYPKHYPPGVRGKIRFWINKYLIHKNIDAIITISETSKKDICRFLGVSPTKVHVTYLASRPIFKKMEGGKWEVESKKQYSLPDRFALYAGDVNYNKNIPNLAKACEIAKIPLVIAGKQALDIEDPRIDLNILKGPMDFLRYLFGRPHPELAHYDEVLAAFRNNKKIIRLGFVPDEDLVKIYNLASVYVQASFYEGFGLPLLEAIACGTPVVATKTQCLVEILGNDFSYVDANDPGSIAKGIVSPNKNKKLPRVYSWTKTGQETLEVYKIVNK